VRPERPAAALALAALLLLQTAAAPAPASQEESGQKPAQPSAQNEEEIKEQFRFLSKGLSGMALPPAIKKVPPIENMPAAGGRISEWGAPRASEDPAQ
jgi:hypothetical protein